MMRYIWKLLDLSWAYSAFRALVGTQRVRDHLTNRWQRLSDGDRVLDIGCGTGEILDTMPNVEYLGLDYSPDYINRAKERYGTRGTFRVFDISADQAQDLRDYDLVLACGVLHHLNDDECLRLMTFARSAMKPGGRFLTVDGVFHEGQSRIAHWVVARDRGRFVRQENAYLELARKVFPIIDHEVLTGMLTIPYSHMVMECRLQS